MERRIPVSEEKIKEGLFRFLSTFYKVLSSATAIEILHMLYSCKPKVLTFTDITSGVKRDRHIVNFLLKKLTAYGLVEQVKEGKYRITEIGVFALKISAAEIITLTEKAIEIGKKKGYVISRD